MSTEVERETIDSSIDQQNLALVKYQNFLPSEVQGEIWSNKFLKTKILE